VIDIEAANRGPLAAIASPRAKRRKPRKPSCARAKSAALFDHRPKTPAKPSSATEGLMRDHVLGVPGRVPRPPDDRQADAFKR